MNTLTSICTRLLETSAIAPFVNSNNLGPLTGRRTQLLFPQLEDNPYSFIRFATDLRIVEWLKKDDPLMIIVLLGWIPIRWKTHSDNIFVLTVPCDLSLGEIVLYLRVDSDFERIPRTDGDQPRAEREQQHFWLDC